MEIKVNNELTIYCDMQVSFACGNAFHVIEIWKDMEQLLSEHIHCCDNGYEAIFYALSKIDRKSKLFGIKDKLIEIVNNDYLANCKED